MTDRSCVAMYSWTSEARWSPTRWWCAYSILYTGTSCDSVYTDVHVHVPYTIRMYMYMCYTHVFSCTCPCSSITYIIITHNTCPVFITVPHLNCVKSAKKTKPILVESSLGVVFGVPDSDTRGIHAYQPDGRDSLLSQ